MESGILQTLAGKIRTMHGDSSGAVAMLMLAAILILMMMVWVVMDAGMAATDKLEVQSGVDVAAYSQSAVEARSMNMIAFANIGKRVTFGMTAFYLALWFALAEITLVAIVLAIACWVANVFALGSLSSICTNLTEFAAESVGTVVAEAPDLATFIKLMNGYYADDVQGFDDYQSYMTEITPWWGFMEAMTRGGRNGATVTVSWPPPAELTGGNLGLGAGATDALPAGPIVDDKSAFAGYTDMCLRVYTEFDFVVYMAEYPLKNALAGELTDGAVFDKWRPVLQGLMWVLALPNLIISGCLIVGPWLGQAAAPYWVPDSAKGSKSDWLMASSNMTIGYKPNPERMGASADKKKYSYLGEDPRTLIPLIYDAGGYWAMARSEISFQDGTPDLWHASWTARMRPVALPGEWSAYGNDVTLRDAYHDVAPTMLIVGSLASFLNGGAGNPAQTLQGLGADVVRGDAAFGSLGDTEIEGLAK